MAASVISGTHAPDSPSPVGRPTREDPHPQRGWTSTMDTNEPSDQPQPLVPARIQANPIAVARPMAVAPAADEVGPAVSLRVVMRALTRHWWQILAIWGVLSVASIYAINKYVWPNYRAIGLLQVEPDPGSPFLSGMRATENFEGYLETQVNLLASPHVMLNSSLETRISTIPRIRDSADPVEELFKIVRAMVRPKTRLIEVSATTKSPADSANIVNSVMDQYLKFITLQLGKSEVKLRSNLEKFKREIEAEVEKTKKDILALAASGVSPKSALEKSDPARAATTELTHEQFSDYSSRLFTTKIERMAAETELAERRAAQEPGADPMQGREQMVKHLFQSDPEVRKLREDISAARAKLEGSGSRSKKNDPANKAIQRKIALMMQQHDEHWKQKYPLLSAQVASGVTGVDTGAELRKLEARVSSLKAAETSYEQSLAQIKVSKRRDSSDAVNMEFLGEELRASRGMLESLDQRLQDLEFSSNGEARISKVADVVAPTGPMSDYRTKLMAGAPLGLMILVAGFFMVLEIRAGRVGTPEDLALRSRVEILGVLPPLPMTQPTRSLASFSRREDQRAAFVQSLDHLRVSLCGEPNQGGGRCVVITSAVGGEGKTTLSVQLAARFAQAGVSTVLVDGDLRRASLSRLLDASESAGLSDVLQGDIDVESALSVCGQAGGFHLLSAGTMGIDPGRLLQGRNVGQILAKLRQTFDVVIIDTPPVLPVPDALTLARWADGAVLAVRRDASRFPLVEQANRRLLGAGIAVLGAVVNGVPSAHSNYGSGYNYSSPAPSRVAEPTA
jgi:succinoglycan biosynthesis transport protein ExoP